MDLSELKPPGGSIKRRRRVGRGIGSGNGKTAGRGHKGRGSRSGGNTPPSYEGGQMPLQRRLPKRGFRRLQRSTDRRERFDEVNVSRLVVFGEGSRIDPAALVERGLARSGHRIKILGNGEVTVRLTVLAHAFSAGASAKIAAAGGSVELIEGAQKLDA